MYSISHKHFLQHILRNGILSVEKALQFFREIGEEAVKDVDSLTKFISEINEIISKQDFKIQLVVCDVTCEKQVVLINTADDDVSRMQNTFSRAELEYFQALVQNIVASRGKKLTYMSCLSLSSTLMEKLSKVKTEKLIKKWIHMGYVITKGCNVHLGARCIAEFALFFESHCRDHISQCYLCSELVFIGQTCDSCKKIMHSHCLEKFLMNRNCCPSCEQEWHDHVEHMSPSREEEDNDMTHLNESDSIK